MTHPILRWIIAWICYPFAIARHRVTCLGRRRAEFMLAHSKSDGRCRLCGAMLRGNQTLTQYGWMPTHPVNGRVQKPPFPQPKPRKAPVGIFDGEFQFNRGELMDARAEGQRDFMRRLAMY